MNESTARPSVPPSVTPTVLAVHDDPACLYWLERTLLAAGYRVVSESTLFQALLRMRDDPAIRLIVADWFLGDVDAAVLVHQVRRRDPTFPVLVMTAMPERFERIRWRLPADVSVLFSPVDDTTLLSAVGMLWRSTGEPLPPGGR